MEILDDLKGKAQHLMGGNEQAIKDSIQPPIAGETRQQGL